MTLTVIRTTFPRAITRVITLEGATRGGACVKVLQAQTVAAAREAKMAMVEKSRPAAEAKAVTSNVALATLAINAVTTLKLPWPLWPHNA
jgi:hypothetical protein